MKNPKTAIFLRIFSLMVIMSLLLAACAPSTGLEGSAGNETATAEATEEVQQEPATEEPTQEVPEPPTQEQVQATEVSDSATDTPVVVIQASDIPSASETPLTVDTPSASETPLTVDTPSVSETPLATDTPAILETVTETATLTPTATNTATPQKRSTVDDPYIGLSVACNNDLSATFTISNNGGDLTGGSYTVTEPGGATQTFPLDLQSKGKLKVNAAGNATVEVNYSTSTLQSVNLAATGECIPIPPTNTPVPTNTATITKTATPTNTFGPSPTPTNTKTPKPTNTATNTRTPTSTITPGPSPTPTNTKTPKPTKTATNTRTPTSTITPGPSPTSTNTKTPVPTKTATLSPTASLTHTATLTMTASLTPTLRPTDVIVDGQLDLQVFCNNDLSASFVITNVSGTVSDGDYSYSDPAGGSDSGSLNLASGDSITIDGAGNGTMVVTYNTTKLASVRLKVTGSCIKVPPTNTPPPATNTPTFTPTVTATSTDVPTLTPTATNTPFTPPALSVSGACTGSNPATAEFTITNTGGDMPSAYRYEITDANNNLAQSGTFQLKAGDSTKITFSGTSPNYNFSSPDDAGLTAQADLTKCNKNVLGSPDLSVTGACTSNSGVATFIVTNKGSDMTTPYQYDITDASGVVVQTAFFQLKSGGSTTITYSGKSSSYTFSSPSEPALTATADMTKCKPPVVLGSPILSVSGACTSNAGVATFVITNTGNDMTTAYTYNVTDASGAVVQTATFKLKSGQSATISVSGKSSTYSLTSPDDPTLFATANMSTCVAPPPAPALSVTGVCARNKTVVSFTITNNGSAMTAPSTYTVTNALGAVVQTAPFNLGSGASLHVVVSSAAASSLVLSVAGAGGVNASASSANCLEDLSVSPANPSICIECLVFHTFRDDNLEVYRLDGIEGQPGFKLYNLSKDGAVDSRPSRAPNDSWVVFQSNRDGNVELYYTDLAGSGEAARLTKTQSNNTNPMYGPDSNTVVFQSDRNGRFDLFTIDQSTGKETQITSDPADDVNPFYSPDLKWLVFQSNRNNNWDLFILNVETGTEYQLTDSPVDETFPGWSPNGKQIAFLSNENGATDLYVMDLDTEEITRLTTDGKTNNATWSPEGNRIAYQSERNGNLDIYSYDFNENKEYHVTDYEGVDSGPTWDCGGTNLAFTSMRDGNPNVFQVFWQGGAASNMTIDPATDKWSQWRPSNDVSSTGY